MSAATIAASAVGSMNIARSLSSNNRLYNYESYNGNYDFITCHCNDNSLMNSIIVILALPLFFLVICLSVKSIFFIFKKIIKECFKEDFLDDFENRSILIISSFRYILTVFSILLICLIIGFVTYALGVIYCNISYLILT